MDEPLSNLDAKLRLHMRTEIKKLQRRVGITTLYITHDQVEAMSMADKIVVMDGGVIKQIGTPEQIYSHPANIFVAGFVGSPAMNFMECKVIKKDLVICLKPEIEMKVEIPVNVMPNIDTIPEQITLGIRPRDIVLLKDKDNFNGLVMNGTISFIESLGDDFIVEVMAGSSEEENKEILEKRPLIKIAAQNLVSRFNGKLNIGDMVTFGIDYNKLHFFNSEDGQRI